MADNTSQRVKKIKERIPEEARQHFKNSREELHMAMEGLLPEGFFEHRRTARKEFLLAMRSLLDSVLERMEKDT